MARKNDVIYNLTRNKQESDDGIAYFCFGIDGIDSEGKGVISLKDISLNQTDVEYLVSKLNEAKVHANDAKIICMQFVDILYMV